MKHRAAKYFQDNETFDQAEFSEQVLKRPAFTQIFEEQKADFESTLTTAIPPEVDINERAVKKHSKRFTKSVIKLDKNFHLYVHGNEEMIERGVDDQKGLNFYKIYFKKED
jgi:hypothetical protein